MTTKSKTLNVTVGEGLHHAAARATAAMRAAQFGKKPAPYFGVSFSEIGQMLATFTPMRWKLIAALRAAGPMTVAELARLVQRDYKNVHTDIAQLIEWLAVERTEDGRVFVPWTDIVVDMKLPTGIAA